MVSLEPLREAFMQIVTELTLFSTQFHLRSQKSTSTAYNDKIKSM